MNDIRLPLLMLWLFCLPSSVLRSAELPLGLRTEGPSFHGQFVGAELATWKWQFDVPDRRLDIPAGELVAWGGFVEPVNGVQILLAGGGLLVVDSVQIDKEQLHGVSQVFGALRLPLELVAGVILRPPLEPAVGDQLLARLATLVGQSDRVLLDNGDELAGTIMQLADSVLHLQTEVGQVEVELKKIAAVLFNPTLIRNSKAQGFRCVVGFRDGSRLTAISLSANQAETQLKLAGGAELKCATGTIVALQPMGGNVVYVSDLKPASYRHIPYLQLSWPYFSDRTALGGQLRAGGNLYLKGLGMHSPARITYDLDRPYRRFEAEGAVDSEAGQSGSVVFRVFVDDGSGSWQERATTATVRGGEPAVPISVDLSGAKRISLLVEFADRGDEQDHADWLNARLVR